MRSAAAALAASVLTALALAAPAPAPAAVSSATTVRTGAPVDANTPVNVPDLDAAQPGRRLTGRQVIAIAGRLPDVRKAIAAHRGAYPGAYTKGPGRWQASWFSRDRPAKEIAQVYVDDASGKVTEHYTGFKVAWTMARGYPGAFGRKINSPWVWIPLTIAFLAPFVLVKGVRFDLLVLAAFGISTAYFNAADIDVSVPFVYPLLAYLLGRMLWLGLRRGDRAPPRPMRLIVPAGWLAIGLVFLLGFRVGLNVTSSNVIDVGYAGVIGADKLAHGQPLYGTFPKDNEHGDTYGPVSYAAYVPFLKAFGFSGRWDDLPAAHAASIFFDLLACALLFLLGRRTRGPTLGIVLAYLWAAYPFSLYASMSNTNDALVSVFVVLALLVATSAPARGAAVALGGLTKFATLALAPLFALDGVRERGIRGVAVFTACFAAVAAVAFSPVVAQGESLSTVYDRTLGFQTSRGSPFSIWGLYDLVTLQHVWQVVAVLLAIAVAVVPRRRDVVGLAACSAVIVIALQLGVTHWFYLYIVWFFPPVAVALFARYAEVAPAPRPAPAVASQATSTGSIAVAPIP